MDWNGYRGVAFLRELETLLAEIEEECVWFDEEGPEEGV
jgi:hypothetical protein